MDEVDLQHLYDRAESCNSTVEEKQCSSNVGSYIAAALFLFNCSVAALCSIIKVL